MRSIPSSRGFSVASQMLTVVKDGLVLNLDAGDTNSYPGTGVTWSDRSTQANSFTLTNGPVYNTTTSPNILIDGVDDYAIDNGNAALKAISNGGNFTVDAWIKINATGNQYLCGNQINVGGSFGFGIVLVPSVTALRIFYTTSSSTFYSITDPAITTATWMHLVTTYQYSDGLGQSLYNLYINSVQKSANSSTQPSGTVSNSANSFFVGRRPNATVQASMNLASLKVYNKILSSTEVIQNFNAARGRFGL